MNRPTTFVEAEANFIADFPGWASRTTQQAFALAVEEALASNQHLLAQAACGTGKSFGVLVPVILDGRRAVVSTATKQLQNQYVEKDLPWLQAHLVSMHSKNSQMVVFGLHLVTDVCRS